MSLISLLLAATSLLPMSSSSVIELGHVAEGKTFSNRPFPLAAFPNIKENEDSHKLESITAWLNGNHQQLDDLLREHKAILFRNFAVKTPNDFNDFVVATGLQGMDYIGGAAPRSQVYGRVFTANESPSSEKIPFHHEMAQVPEPPTHLFFFCENAPEEGGEVRIRFYRFHS
jgi:hypothetical protein